MSLTISGYASMLSARKNIGQAQQTQQSAMEKLSSGLNINKGSDNPAGLLISEMLRSELSGYQRALSNTQETNNMMAVAEGGLSSVSSMLYDMKSLATHALNSGVTTGMQTAADQMQINSSLTTINRIVSTTNYAGTNLLDGTRDFTFDTADSANILNANGTDIQNMSGTAGNRVNVTFDGGRINQAERAYVEADFGGATLGAAQDFTVTGNNGSATFSFGEGTSIEDMASQINAMADSTGVNAYAIRDEGTGATAMRLVSTEYGSDASVQVVQNQGTGFAQEGGTVRDAGQDVTVNVNGSTVTGEGLNVDYSQANVTGNLAFNAGDAAATTVAQTGYDQDEVVDATAARSAALTNVQGGMQLQLGSGAGGQNRETVSLGNYSSGRLGQVEYNGETYSLNDLYGGGAASLANNPELAMQIIDQAISDVASGRANIGAYQANTLDTNANNLMAAFENTTRTESGIRDADFARLISEFTTASTQREAGMRMLQVQMEQVNPQNILQLLGAGF